MERLKQKTYTLLRKSEAFFKTDMVYLAKGGFWLTSTQFIGAISAFILSIAFAHLLPKEGYGTYKYVLALSGIIGTFTLNGLGTAVAQSVAQGYEGSLMQGFKIKLKWNFAIVFISLGVSAYYYLHNNFILALSLLIIGVTLPLIDAASLFSSYLNGKKEFSALAKFNVLGNIFPTTILISTLFVTQNVLIIIIAYFLSYLLSQLFSYFFTKAKYKSNNQNDPDLIKYAKHLTAINILNVIADQLDKIIVYHYIGAAELAIYAYATALPTQIKGIFKGIFPLALPKFAQRELEEVRRELPGKMLRFFIIIAITVIAYIITAPWIYSNLFPQYTDAIRISQIFSLSLLAYAGALPVVMLQAKKALPSLYKTNLIVAPMKIGMLFLGVIYGGFWGLIIARIAYEYAGLCVVLIYTRKT